MTEAPPEEPARLPPNKGTNFLKIEAGNEAAKSARVYVDGEEKGNLSQGVLLVGQLGEGQHQVQAQGERIEELQTQVRFDGQNQWQTLTLNATPSTRMVVIMTEPPNAVVEWEGKTLPEKTPTSQQVQVGQSVNVRLELEGYKVREEQFRVDQKGPPYRWNVKLYQPTQTTLHIQSEPEGANVNLDGTPVGTTPMQIQLGAGDHQLTLEKEGYHAQQEHINITPEQLWQDQQLRRTLQNITQSIQIRTNVEGATIYIDGEEKGEAPQTQEFAWGSTHTIVAKAEGYHDAQQTWQWVSKDLQRGEQIQLQLEKRPVTLMIQSEPQEANLQVDGEEKANGSVQLQVEWGKVLNLQASAPGYEPLEQSYTPEKSPERQSITLKLQKRTTVIHLQSEPEGARIEVDGKNVGSAPVTVNLEEGTHEIQATKSGYLEAKKSIVVTIETGTSKDLGRERVEKLVLQKAPGKVNITTSPSGASIYINGSYKGTSSYTYEGEEGNIQVEVRKSGYHSKSETFRVEAGKTTSERISLEQVTGKVLITPQQTGLLVLSVGVSNYQSSQVNDLLSPADDARDFASLMQKKYNVPSSNVRLLVDSQASKAGIVAGLNWLVSQANSSKDVLIFFSGHGGQLKDENGDEDDGMDELLCPYDFSMQDKVNTALLDDEIAVFIQTLTSKANSVTFIFDSCFGGESGSKAMDINVSSNFAFLAASKGNETARDFHSHFGHSLYTYFLLKGLDGAADSNKDGQIGTSEIHNYIYKEIGVVSQSAGQYFQTPILDPTVNLVIWK